MEVKDEAPLMQEIDHGKGVEREMGGDDVHSFRLQCRTNLTPAGPQSPERGGVAAGEKRETRRQPVVCLRIAGNESAHSNTPFFETAQESRIHTIQAPGLLGEPAHADSKNVSHGSWPTGF